MATKRTAGLLAACVVAAIVGAGLLTTCEETVKSAPESAAAVAPAPTGETAPTKPVAPRRVRQSKGEPAAEQELAEGDQAMSVEQLESVPVVVLTVEVVDAETGRPVTGAKISTTTKNGPAFRVDGAVTDENGRAAAFVGAAELVETSTRAAGHIESTDYVRTTPVGSPQPTLRVELVRGGTLRGVVRDPDGNPAQQSTVDVRCADVDDVLQSEPSGPDGAYVVEGLTFGGSYTAVANHSFAVADACLSAESGRVIATKEHPDVVADLRLRRYGSMVLTVFDGETAIDDSLAVKLSMKVSSDDTVAFRSGSWADRPMFVAPGKCSLVLWFDDRAVVRDTVDVPEGGTVKKTIRLTTGETISGLVVDDDGAPVDDAWIRDGAPPEDAREPRTVTQSRADGAFELTQLTAGDHELRVSPPFEFEDVVVRAAAPAENVRLVVSRRGELKLRAVFDGDAKPAADARIAFHGTLDGKSWDIDRLLPLDGRFEIAWPAGVTGDVGIAVDGFVPVTRSVTVTAGATVDLGEIRMQPACVLSGWLHDDDGEPRKEATLFVRGAMGDRKCKTGAADGRFSFRGLSSGTLRLDLAETPHASFVVDVPSVKAVVLVIPKSGLLQVFASNSSGQRLAARRVDVIDADGVTVDGGTTDANGSWTSNLAPGRYSVRVEGGPHADAEIRAEDVTVLRLR